MNVLKSENLIRISCFALKFLWRTKFLFFGMLQGRSIIVKNAPKAFSKRYAVKIEIKQAKQQPHLRFPDLTG
jgi:hypothetical protein